MAKDNAQAPSGGNVVAMSTNCCAEKCAKKVERMGFCGEHFAWFKAGLINKKGQKPTDFDKKYQAYVTKAKKAA